MRKTARRDRRLELYYIVNLRNLGEILQHGILSRDMVEKQGLSHKEIANKQIVEKRRLKGLTGYVPLYIYPRNAMLYQLLSMNWPIIIIGIDASVINKKGSKISIGNAASDYSVILHPEEVYVRRLFEEIRDIRDWISEEANIPIQKYVKEKEFEGKFLFPKTFLQSEALIPQRVPKKYIRAIYVPNHELQEKVKKEYGEMLKSIEVIVDPDLFFQPLRKVEIYENLFIVHGDMFDSQMQTLTISVNTVGVMGKGLASRFKYMYPAAFVVYQDLTKRKILKPGKPYLYKPETRNGERWFLFFPTKRHWKEKSDPHMIEKGLEWFVKCYKKEGVKSIAFPALGCGLGGLSWEEIGPLMVRYLKEVDIPVEIYIPTRNPKEHYFKREFYEGQVNDDYPNHDRKLGLL